MAMLMHIHYTHCWKSHCNRLIGIALTKSLAEKPKLGKTMNIIYTKTTQSRRASIYDQVLRHTLWTRVSVLGARLP